MHLAAKCIFSVRKHVEDARLRSVRRARQAMHVLATSGQDALARRLVLDVYTRSLSSWEILERYVFLLILIDFVCRRRGSK